MSSSDQESKTDGKLVSIPLSSDDETSAGRNKRSTEIEGPAAYSVTSRGSLLDLDEDEAEEKARLINQVLELQNTLDDLSQRVDAVKDENLKLKSENQVLGQYIENLMSASSVFQATNTAGKKRSSSAKPSSKKGDKK